MKKALTVLAAFSEALAEGAAMLPNLMLVGLFYQHYGQVDYVLPFVLLYAFEKAGVFLLSGFGRLKNPRLLWLGGNVLAAAGCAVMLLGGGNNLLWDIGAVLLGLGLSGFSAMYRTTRDATREKGLWKPGVSLMAGYLILPGLMLFVMLQRNSHMAWVAAGMLLLILVSTLHCLLLRGQCPYRGAPPYEKNTVRPAQFAYAAIVLLFTLVVRLYKQTASAWLISGVVLGLLVVLLAAMLLRRKGFRPWSLRTLWYGAQRNFVTVFSLICFLAKGEPGKVTVAYLMIGVGVCLAKAVTPAFRRRVPADAYERVCAASVCAASCLMLVPLTACYMAGVLLTVVFVSMGNAASLQSYLGDERFPATERRLVRARFYGLGAVVEQAFMLIALFAASALAQGSGTSALEGYALQAGSASNGAAFTWTLAACIAINGLWAWRFAGFGGAADAGDGDK